MHKAEQSAGFSPRPAQGCIPSHEKWRAPIIERRNRTETRHRVTDHDPAGKEHNPEGKDTTPEGRNATPKGRNGSKVGLY